MKFLITFVASLLCLVFNIGAAQERDIDTIVNMDLDGDGVPDRIDISKYVDPDDINMNNMVLIKIRITFASSGVVEETIPIAGYLSQFFYPSERNGYLLFDYTNRVSRDAAELSYVLLKWDNALKKWCSYVTVGGMPRNQLRSELYPSAKYARIYNGCSISNDQLPDFTSADDYWETERNISTKVAVDRAWLYNRPDSRSKTGMYLVQGDEVKVTNYKFNSKSGIDFFLVEYYNKDKKVTIKKWLEGKSIGLNLPN